MPATVRKRGSKYRVTERDGRLVRSTQGKPVDGGGFATKRKALQQKRAINQGK